MKRLRIFLLSAVALNSGFVFAENWSDVQAGPLSLRGDFQAEGRLNRGLLGRIAVDVSIFMESEKLAEQAPRPDLENSHRLIIYIDGVRCEAAGHLFADRTERNIRYGMRVEQIESSVEGEDSICPYYLRFYFGEMEEGTVGNVFTQFHRKEGVDSPVRLYEGELYKE